MDFNYFFKYILIILPFPVKPTSPGTHLGWNPRSLYGVGTPFKKGKLIREQGFIHKDIIIEDDCWFGANTVINKGVVIKSGSVIGASSLVNKSTEKDSINVGIPAKKIAEREN